MRFWLTLLLLPFAGHAAALHGLIRPAVTFTQVGETILDPGSTEFALKTNKDAIYYQTNFSGAAYLNNFVVSPTPAEWESSNTNVVTMDGNTVSLISTGAARLTLYYGLLNKRRFNAVRDYVAAENSGNLTNYYFQTNTIGSLAHHVSTNTFSRLTGDPVVRRPVFSTRVVSATNYVRNSNFFLADVPGIESYIAGNNSGAANMNGVLVSPRHILSVQHTGSQMGQTVFFVNRTNNAVLARSVIATARAWYGQGDMTVGLLNEPLPSSIIPAAVLHSTNTYPLLPGYVPTIGSVPGAGKIPVVGFNQDIKPSVLWVDYILSLGYATKLFSEAPTWTQQARGGDSGSPLMMPMAGRMVVLGNWTTGNSGMCAWQAADGIQWTMDLLCAQNSFTNESLALIDPELFPDWGPIKIVGAQETNSASAGTTITLNCVVTKPMFDGCVVVSVGQFNSTTAGAINSATFNGSTMTSVTANITGGGDTDGRMFVLPVGHLAPGSYPIVVLVSHASSKVAVNALLVNNVHQSTPIGTGVSATGNSTAPSVAASSAAGEVVVDMVTANQNVLSSTWTLGAGQTRRSYSTSGSGNQAAGMSSEPGASSVTMSHTLSSAADWISIAVPLKPANP